MFLSFSMTGYRLAAVVIVLLALIAGGLYLITPRVTVEISPALREVKEEIPVVVTTGVTEPNFESGQVPARRIARDFQAEIEAPATGTHVEGIAPSRGEVVVINRSTETRVLPAGTVFERSDGFTYRTAKEVTVPSRKEEYVGEIQVESRAGQAEVEIVAKKKGLKGNLSTEHLLVPVDFGEELRAVNVKPVSGGEDRTYTVVSEEDLDTVRKKLASHLDEQMEDVVRNDLDPTSLLLASTIQPVDTEYFFDVEVGQEAETIRGELTALVSGLYVDREVFKKHLIESFLDHLPQNHRLATDNLEIQEVVVERREDDSAKLNIVVAGRAMDAPNPAQLAAELRGRSASEVEDVLAGVSGIEDYSFEADRAMPRFAHWIDIQIRSEESAQPVTQ